MMFARTLYELAAASRVEEDATTQALPCGKPTCIISHEANLMVQHTDAATRYHTTG